MQNLSVIFDCISQDRDCFDLARSKLEKVAMKEEDRRLFTLIAECWESQGQASFFTLTNQNHLRPKTQKVLSAKLTEFQNLAGPQDFHNFESLLSQVLMMSKAEQMALLMSRYSYIVSENPADIDTNVQNLLKDISGVVDNNTLEAEMPVDFADLASTMEQDILRGQIACYTGFKAIDKKVDGFEIGDLWVIGARPGIGKTTWALVVCKKSDFDICVFCSFEMPNKKLASRALNVWFCHNKKYRNLTPDDRIRQMQSIKNQQKLFIYDCGGKTESYVEALMRQWRKKHPDKKILFVIDYFQIIQCSSKQRDARQKYNHILNKIDTARKVNGISTLLLSQITREADKDRPRLGALKETADLEQTADLVMYLIKSTGDLSSYDNGVTIPVEFIIAKSRSGGLTDKNEIIYDFNRMNTTYYEQKNR